MNVEEIFGDAVEFDPDVCNEAIAVLERLVHMLPGVKDDSR